jgi:hypothetical protein
MVQHESFVDVAELVNFMIGTLKSDLQFFLDSLEVLDMANGCLQKHEYKELIIEVWDAYHSEGWKLCLPSGWRRGGFP